jgi:hypothetical protein
VEELVKMGHQVCPTVVGDLLRGMGYSRRANSKTQEGSKHIDRDAQFHCIDTQAKVFLAAHQPVASLDTKKKGSIGNFKNNGRKCRPTVTPELVNIHDPIDPKLSRAVPCGVYDIINNVGWVSVGTDHDTAAFAVNAIRRWWRTIGRKRHPKAKRLIISADGGGSNGYRVRKWKVELQKLADEIKLPIAVCHLPPVIRQMQQNRVSPLLVHHHQLARQAAAQLSQDRPAHCCHHNRYSSQGARRTRPKQRASRFPTQRWPSTSHATHSIATETTRFHLTTKASRQHTSTEFFMADP